MVNLSKMSLIFQSRDSCSYASKKNVTKMLEQFKSPVKQNIDMKLKLTPEEKMHFRVAQESDPKFLAANQKLEESLLKYNGSKFRLSIKSNRLDSTASKSDPAVDTTEVNLDSSNDIFDQMVAAKKVNRIENGSGNKSNDSLKKQIEMNSVNDSSSGIDKIETKSTDRTLVTKPSEKGIPKNKFVFRTATASKIANTENKKVERSKPTCTVTKSSIDDFPHDDNENYDVDTVLRELSFENHLPIGANRPRPNSPLQNAHDTTRKSLNSSTLQRNETSKIVSECSNSQSRSSFSSPNQSCSSTPNSISLNVSDTDYIDQTRREPPSKTGFENLQNVLNRISNSSAVKTISNVSSLQSTFRFLFPTFCFSRYKQPNRSTLEELQKYHVQLMESCCDIIDRLPAEAYSKLFGAKVNEFVQLRSLRSKVRAKIVKFDKLLQNRTSPVPVIQPNPIPNFQSKPVSDFQHTPTSTTGNTFGMDDDEELCPDLIDFLKLNEEERDSWGMSNECSSK